MLTKTYSIHPAIGVARVGSSTLEDGNGNPSQESFFIGPEAPGFDFSPMAYDGSSAGDGAGKYRDSKGSIRRQGARFRIYESEVDAFSGRIHKVREITSDHATITWTVHLANKKAAGIRFPPYDVDLLPDGYRNRNSSIEDDDRNELIIIAKAEITKGQASKVLRGEFLSEKIKLGNLITDEHGRLIVLGGHGQALSPKKKNLGEPYVNDKRLPHWIYNNDWWCDDTSDGSISATIKFGDGTTVNVDQPPQRAWVLVAPPDHAAAVQSPITLFDVVFQANLRHRKQGAHPERVSFTRDIYPMFRRAVDLQWVSELARMGHSEHDPGNFLEPEHLKVFANNSSEHRWSREYFVSRLTTPDARGDKIDMPDLYGGVDPQDPYKKPVGRSDYDRRDYFGIPLTVTPYQREVFQHWASGNFDADWEGEPTYPPLHKIEVKKQPEALDRAALESGSGGSFHPGIEAPFTLAREDTFGSWFRIAESKLPGDLTQLLAVPWHVDFLACSDLWWPGQRPVSVPVRIGEQTENRPWHRRIRFNFEGNWIPDLLKLGFVKATAEDGVFELERELPEKLVLEFADRLQEEELQELLRRIRIEGLPNR